MIYKFENVLNSKELDILKKNNIPLECERNIDAVWEIITMLTHKEPLTEEIEILTDKLQDNI